jgi:molecular chaperone HscB
MDHFARLGLPAALELEPASLDRAYFALQRQWHPDRFVNRSAAERARASSEAAALNDAYRTLKDPLRRAAYLAELKGVALPADGTTIDDPDLLMEAMEAREALHEASTVEAIDSLARQARSDVEDGLRRLAGLLPQADDPAVRPAIRKALLRLRYLDKFAEEAGLKRTNIERSTA